MALLEPQTHSRRYKLTVDDFYRLDLPHDKNYELLEGVIYEMPAIGPLHATLVRKFQDVFYKHFRDRAIISTQNPVLLGKYSLPQPDIALIRDADYSHEHPQVEDTYLVIEVAVTTLEDDREKLAVYAKAGIPEVWIVNPKTYRIEVYREPEGRSYKVHFDHDLERPIASLAFPDDPLKLNW
ncbi:MAG: Uma2 family endonuclease [Meiothermus sp.]